MYVIYPITISKDGTRRLFTKFMRAVDTDYEMHEYITNPKYNLRLAVPEDTVQSKEVIHIDPDNPCEGLYRVWAIANDHYNKNGFECPHVNIIYEQIKAKYYD